MDCKTRVYYTGSKANKQPEVFLDPNTFSADGTTALTSIDLQKMVRICAYQISEGGSD
jgi:prolyl oligopeptidase